MQDFARFFFDFVPCIGADAMTSMHRRIVEIFDSLVSIPIRVGSLKSLNVAEHYFIGHRS
jgi:phosphoribosyl 1,2-cyclic phosphodiesterase